MIVSFKDRGTAEIYHGISSKPGRRACPVNVQRIALRKLTVLNRAIDLDDLAAPPGNRLEALKGDRTGQYSIRINDQFRICFIWTAKGPAEVEIVDYH